MNARVAAERLLDIDGLRIQVAVRPGDPHRTPLLLMNGIGAGIGSWQPLIDVLDVGLPLIRFNAPGIGGSDLPALPYRFCGLARRLGRLLDLLDCPQVDVLGISWGGGLAQQFARTQRRRCRRLVLVATATGSIMVPAAPSVLAKMAVPRRYHDPEYLRAAAPDLYGGSARTEPDRIRRILLEHTDVAAPRAYLYQLLAGLGWTSLPFLPTLRQPTLVLTGDDDPLIPLVNGRLLAALIPKARLHVYPGGHLEIGARPEVLAPVIEHFLAAGGDRAG